MSQDIVQELDFFAASFLLGILLVLVYDALRIFRRLVRHGALWLSVEDMWYWVGSAFAIFAMLYRKNDGLIRGFAVGGVGLGMLLYNRFISRYTVRYLAVLLKKIICLVEIPFRGFYRLVCPKVLVLQSKRKKTIKYVKKRLKKLRNEIKMGISK